jgi:hypothetical protein
MFWKRKDSEGQSGPKDIPDIIKKSPEFINNINTDTAPFLKILTKNSDNGEKTYDFRIYDPSDAEARVLTLKNYSSLEGHDDVIIADGLYSDQTKKVDINIRKVIPKPKLFTQEEILAQIEGMKEPGGSIFFFMASGPGAGGPLGRGASIVKLNNPNSEKKTKKYSVYGSPVIGDKPVEAKMLIIFSMDKAKDIAKWISEGHKTRFC